MRAGPECVCVWVSKRPLPIKAMVSSVKQTDLTHTHRVSSAESVWWKQAAGRFHQSCWSGRTECSFVPLTDSSSKDGRHRNVIVYILQWLVFRPLTLKSLLSVFYQRGAQERKRGSDFQEFDICFHLYKQLNNDHKCADIAIYTIDIYTYHTITYCYYYSHIITTNVFRPRTLKQHPAVCFYCNNE